ncbi:tRNA-uridine aminocarboxypropyltransferase [Massilia sp. 9096]|uniref:tRNA-uridine aminocarboxypropyltransferase n=1 Tax=Massilia sp. 9096 TaxID=1500894 RepID=UPI00055F0D6B|nr:tRNA-uridine aminocarboxypropyltransferase [Massilia sp. 9096]
MNLPDPSHPPAASDSRRASCAACLRPASACICSFVQPLASRAELLILQHPLEVRNAKNSARLLHLCLPASRVAVGEAFDPAELDALLHDGGRTPLLLYPDTPGDASLGIVPPPVLDAGLLAHPDKLRLVVLDGTWRKSRKMLYINTPLQRLARLGLSHVPPSAYRIRKAHAAHQLSTLEATALALAQLEGDPGWCAPLLEAFDVFVQHQANFSPRLNHM